MSKVRFEPYDVNWCRAKRFPTANLVELLRRREMGQRPEGSNMVAGSREFYHSIRPERSEYSALGKQPFYLLRFTPDGSRLLALDAALKEVRIYAYRGVHQAAAKAKWGHSWELFEKIFSKHIAVQFWDVRNPRCPERLQFGALSRDCAHVTPDSAFLVVSASLPLNESQALFSGISQNNESLPPNSSLTHTTFYSIDLKKGQVVDKCRFEFDQIDAVSGVYMMDWTLAILSIQHQTIHLLAVDRLSGQLIRLKQLGPSMLDDDPLWEPTPPPGCCFNFGAGGGDQLFTAFRQAFLTFLYKDHAQQQRGKVQQLLAHFDFYKSLKIHSFQFAGPELLLIRMELMAANRANGSSALTSQQSHQSMFVLLEWRQGKIVGAFEPNSPSLFGALERHGESFKNGHLATNHFPTSMEHCGPARDWHQKLKESHLAVMSPEETRRRFLSQFPVPNTQHFMASPYLDPEMFHFDEHLAAHLERGKLREDQMPMKLFSRRTNTCHSRFEFRAGSVSKSGCMRVLFHPRDPLVISMNRDFQLDSLICFYMPKMAPADV